MSLIALCNQVRQEGRRQALVTGTALPLKHHTYSYKILQKTGRRDIFRLHPADTVRPQTGSPVDRQHREPFVADTYSEIEAEIPRLRRYARALTRDVAAADDLVQDCLTRALGKLHLWEKGTDLRAWLFTILHNQYVNYVRRSVREGAAVGLSDSEPLLTRAPQQGQRLELRDLERAIAKLPEEQQSAILLVGLEGMRYEEVAAVLDVPVGTIRSRLSRGREALRRLVGIDPDERRVPAVTNARKTDERPDGAMRSRDPNCRRGFDGTPLRPRSAAKPVRVSGFASGIDSRRKQQPASEGTNRTALR
jgi:RNA polymerase sigma-70 factor (ECF subfamily)